MTQWPSSTGAQCRSGSYSVQHNARAHGHKAYGIPNGQKKTKGLLCPFALQCAYCVQGRIGFAETPIGPMIAVHGHLSERCFGRSDRSALHQYDGYPIAPSRRRSFSSLCVSLLLTLPVCYLRFSPAFGVVSLCLVTIGVGCGISQQPSIGGHPPRVDRGAASRSREAGRRWSATNRWN